MQLAFAATMIRPGRLHDSLIAWKLSASEFLHSLGQNRSFMVSVAKVRLRIRKRTFEGPGAEGES
jgi:hypothetical protein